MAAKNKGRSGKQFFRDAVAELKKVAWPNRRETMVYTVVVIITVAVVALLIGTFDALLKLIFAKVSRL